MPITKGSFGGRYEERAADAAMQQDEDDRAGGKKVTLKEKGKKPISFKPGGLHESLGVPDGEPIPAEKMVAAKAGKYGPKAQKQANFAANVLAQGQKTAQANAKRSGARGTLPPALKAHEFKPGGKRAMGADAAAAVVPTAMLGAKKSRGDK